MDGSSKGQFVVRKGKTLTHLHVVGDLEDEFTLRRSPFYAVASLSHNPSAQPKISVCYSLSCCVREDGWVPYLSG